MFVTLVVLCVAGAIAYRVATPDERQKLLERYIRPTLDVIGRLRLAEAPFRTTLRDRTPRIIVSPALAAITTCVFIAMIFRDGAVAEPATLLAWGANSGAQTTAGEWWRLVAATVVHPGAVSLLITVIGLIQVGGVVERLVGASAVAFVYLAAGSLGHAVALSNDPVGMHAGGFAGVFGLYGVLLAAEAWGRIRRVGSVIPIATIILIFPGALLLLLSSLFRDWLLSELAGLAAGVVIGLAATTHATVKRSPFYYAAIPTAAAAAMVMYVAIPVQAHVDVKRTLSRVVAVEQSTAQKYDEHVGRFTKNGVPVDTRKMAALIEGEIVPELTAAAAEVDSLKTINSEHEPHVAAAKEYLRLRAESWRARADGLRKSSPRVLQQADHAAQTAIETLRPLRDFSSDDNR